MPYITFTEHPDAPGRQYREAFNISGINYAEVDELLEKEQETTEEEYQKLKVQAEQEYQVVQEAEANKPQELEARAEPKPTLEDVLAVLPPEIMTALNTRLLEKSQEITLSDNVS